MNHFQIVTIILSSLALFGSIVTVYIASRVSIARIEVEIISIKKDLMTKEIALCLLEKNNREDHKDIITKIDKITEYVKK